MGDTNPRTYVSEKYKAQFEEFLRNIPQAKNPLSCKSCEADALRNRIAELEAELASYSIVGDVSEAISFLETSLKDDVALSGAFSMVHGWMKGIRKSWQEQKHELAVLERAMEILENRWLNRGRVDSALYQARAELGAKPGTHITRAEALDKASDILKQAEQWRDEQAMSEAERGIQYNEQKPEAKP